MSDTCRTGDLLGDKGDTPLPGEDHHQYDLLYDLLFYLPLIYVMFTLLRAALIGCLAPLMFLAGAGMYMPWQVGGGRAHWLPGPTHVPRGGRHVHAVAGRGGPRSLAAWPHSFSLRGQACTCRGS